jgi:hypothetical protein
MDQDDGLAGLVGAVPRRDRFGGRRQRGNRQQNGEAANATHA